MNLGKLLILKSIGVGVLVFGLIFGGSFHIIGPISARIVAFFVIIILGLNRREPNVFPRNCRSLFLAWTCIYLCVNIFQGYAFEEDFYKNLISGFLVSIAIMYMLPRIIITKEQVNIIVIWFSIFYILNALVTIGQFSNIALCWSIADFIAPLSGEMTDKYDQVSSLNMPLIVSICPGISGFVVNNGYIIACFLPLVTIGYWERNSLKRLLSFVVFLLALYAAFSTQQRMCVAIVIVYFLYMAFFRSKKQALIVASIIVAGIIYLSDTFSDIDLDIFGRIFANEESGRGNIYSDLAYFFSHPDYVLLGHDVVRTQKDIDLVASMGHICFLDAFRRGGVFTFAIFCVLFYRILKESCKIVHVAHQSKDYNTMMLGICTALNVLYSLTHSSGITSGSILVFAPYILMHISYSLNQSFNHDSR